MNKLTEDARQASVYKALKLWAADKKKRGISVSVEQILNFIQVLNEKTPQPTSPEALLDLVQEEKIIRRYVVTLLKQYMESPDKVVVNLVPSTLYAVLVKGGHPSVITLGITRQEPDFKSTLRRAVFAAIRLWRQSALVPVSKIYEYNRKAKKFLPFKGDPEFYPMLEKERIQVRVFTQVKVTDMRTGESATRTKQDEIGMFKHFESNQLAHEARMDLSRKMFSEGKLKSEDYEYEPETGDMAEKQ